MYCLAHPLKRDTKHFQCIFTHLSNVANTQTFFVLGLLKQNCQEKVILHLSDTYLQLKALPVRNLFLFVCLCGSCLVRIEFSLFVL